MRFITIHPGGGRFANRVIMYMAALAIARRIGGAVICGVGFADWNIPEIAPPDAVSETITVGHPDDFNLETLAAAALGKPSLNIELKAHMQNIGQLLDVSEYRAVFPLLHRDVPIFDERYLLIHIRGDDILNGSWRWYPLIPIAFYRELVSRTGKMPVFMGELSAGPYVNALRAAFPEAAFLPQQTLQRDFDTLRSARNIVLSVSTFSWVAAWLSESAQHIHLPLNGFFNPAHMRHIDLLPVDDPRYHFHLFAFNEAVPEVEALKVHANLKGWWRDISAAQLRHLISGPPGISAPPDIQVDRRWYLSAYLDAAMAISLGEFENAAAHYAHVGRERGYLPFAPVIADVPLAANVALHKPATQSSIFDGAAVTSPEIDAAGAVDGDVTKAMGFHTARQDGPWWMVDLLALHSIQEVHIYNRAAPHFVMARAAPLVLRVSADATAWTELLRTAPDELFGAERGPLCWRSSPPVRARFVQVMIDRANEYLHLAQVAVFGQEL